MDSDDAIYNCISNMVQYRKSFEKIIQHNRKIMETIEIQAVFIYVQLRQY